MDDGKKKTIMLVIIGVCFLIVAIMTVGRMGGGVDTIPDFEGQTTWVLCRNESCVAQFEIPKKDYFEYLKEHDNPQSPLPPALICEKCNQESIYRAVCCAKCGLVFENGAIFEITLDIKDYPDRCPKCRYSQREVDRGVVYKPKK